MTIKLEKQGIEKGLEKGIEKEKIQTAKRMLRENISLEIIVKITGLSINQIKQLSK